jgi:hypothetical protein
MRAELNRQYAQLLNKRVTLNRATIGRARPVFAIVRRHGILRIRFRFPPELLSWRVEQALPHTRPPSEKAPQQVSGT